MENGQSLEWVFWLGTLIMSSMAVGVVLLAVFYQRKVFGMKQRETVISIKAALKAEEKERNRVAADLHDGISGNLSAILNLVRLLEVTEKKEAVIELTKEIKNALETSLNGVQRISYNLMPPLLEKQGLLPVLKDFFHRTQNWYGISIREDYQVQELRLTQSERYDLYRVIQELTDNALQHGKAKHITFIVEQTADQYIFTFKDDGETYDFYTAEKESKGMGIKNIITRLSNSKATLRQQQSNTGNIIVIEKQKVYDTDSPCR